MNTLKQAFSTYHSTLGAIIACFFGFVLFAPEHFDKWPVIKDLAAYGALGGLATIGIGAFQGLKKQ